MAFSKVPKRLKDFRHLVHNLLYYRHFVLLWMSNTNHMTYLKVFKWTENLLRYFLMRFYSFNIEGFCFYFLFLKNAFKKYFQNSSPPKSWKLSHPLHSHSTHPMMDPNYLWPDLQPQASPDKPFPDFITESWCDPQDCGSWVGIPYSLVVTYRILPTSPSKKGILFALWSLKFFNLSDLKFPLSVNWK